jgi:hypothetical protein
LDLRMVCEYDSLLGSDLDSRDGDSCAAENISVGSGTRPSSRRGKVRQLARDRDGGWRAWINFLASDFHGMEILYHGDTEARRKAKFFGGYGG